jgi:hypothetical protein
MPFVVPLLLLASVPGPAIFDQSVAAFRARKAFSVAIAMDATLNGNTTTARYKLSYVAPSKVLLTKVVNGIPNLVFWLNGSKFVAYDPAAKEMAIRRSGLKGPVVNRLANAVGGIEDPVSVQLAPDSMAAFLSPFKLVQGWTSKVKGEDIVLTRPGKQSGKPTLTEFQFSRSTKLLTRALLVGPTSKLQWVFQYGPKPESLSFNPAPGTKVVVSLTEHTPINASSAKAQKIVEDSLRTYGRLTSLSFSVVGTTGSSTDWMAKGAYRERQPSIEWSYRDNVLTIRDLKKGRSYRGKCKPSAILSFLKLLRRPMDPVLQALILHRNPIGNWFMKDMTVVDRGNVKIGNVVADAVELRSPKLEISLLIRRDNHLIATVSSRTKDSSGQVISESNRRFTYWSVNQPLSATAFTIPATKPLPLAKVGK